jgi:pimeloyl-ACP methyl ester carboxylesterase
MSANQPPRSSVPPPSDEALLDRGGGAAPEIRAPLAAFAGERPPAPAWFEEALADAPERSLVATPRGRLELLTWGARGRPGVVLVHGNRAHADWWSFIAPFLAEDYRVAALSLAGMGGSDWRERYDYESFADDLEAVAEAAGLHEADGKPVYVGHSFGGGVVFHVAAHHPDRLRAAILIDVGFAGPAAEQVIAERQKQFEALRAKGAEQRPNRIYPTLAEALAHFRLAPPQPLENTFAVDYIARHALKRAPLPDGSGEGWTWKFDPDIWNRLDRNMMQTFLAGRPAIEVPLAHVYGEKSPFRPEKGRPGPLPEDGLLVGIPEAHHHVPIDQPLALVATIRALLAGWRA